MFLIKSHRKVCGVVLAAYTLGNYLLCSGQVKLSKPPPPLFPAGETLVYEVRWDPPGWMFFLPTVDAGEITLKFQERLTYNGNPAFKITADAISSGFLPRITGVSVQDYFESIIDAREFCSLKLIKKTREGKRQRDIILTFDREKGRGHFVAYDVSKKPPVELKNDEVQNIPSCVQDFLSAIYHTRLRDLKIGGSYPLTVSDNGMVKQVEIRVRKRESVECALGKYSALKVETISVFGGLFRGGGTFIVWFSDDPNKIPIKFEAKVKLGKVFGSIKKMENTRLMASGKTNHLPVGIPFWQES